MLVLRFITRRILAVEGDRWSDAGPPPSEKHRCGTGFKAGFLRCLGCSARLESVIAPRVSAGAKGDGPPQYATRAERSAHVPATPGVYPSGSDRPSSCTGADSRRRNMMARGASALILAGIGLAIFA